MCASRFAVRYTAFGADGHRGHEGGPPVRPHLATVVTQKTERQEQLGACSAAVMPPALGTSATKKVAKDMLLKSIAPWENSRPSFA